MNAEDRFIIDRMEDMARTLEEDVRLSSHLNQEDVRYFIDLVRDQEMDELDRYFFNRAFEHAIERMQARFRYLYASLHDPHHRNLLRKYQNLCDEILFWLNDW